MIGASVVPPAAYVASQACRDCVTDTGFILIVLAVFVVVLSAVLAGVWWFIHKDR